MAVGGAALRVNIPTEICKLLVDSLKCHVARSVFGFEV